MDSSGFPCPNAEAMDRKTRTGMWLVHSHNFIGRPGLSVFEQQNEIDWASER